MNKVVVHHATSADRLAAIHTHGLRPTTRKASWLGFGIYFFYRARGRACEWAIDTARRRGSGPALVTAEIDLTDCINLLDNGYWDLVRAAYEGVGDDVEQVGPGYLYDASFTDHDKVGWNYRDCAAMNDFIGALKETGTPIRSIIAAFAEGKPVATDSWLFDKSSVMVSVIDPSVIRIIDAYEID